VRINKNHFSYLDHASCHLSTLLHIFSHHCRSTCLFKYWTMLFLIFQKNLPIQSLNNVRINQNHSIKSTFLTLTMLLVIFPLSFISVLIIVEELAYWSKIENLNPLKRNYSILTLSIWNIILRLSFIVSIVIRNSFYPFIKCAYEMKLKINRAFKMKWSWHWKRKIIKN